MATKAGPIGGRTSPPVCPTVMPTYRRYVMPWMRGVVAGWVKPATVQARLNRRLSGYPHNHDFRIVGDAAVPSRRLHAFWSRIASLYPDRLTSLLDVGSFKGYFVLEAARRPTCRAAVGIDVHAQFVATSLAAAAMMKLENAAFYLASLDQFAADPEMPNTNPFQTVLLLNIYHYLFAGDGLSPSAYRDHRAILALLYDLCGDRVIFSNPLELAHCPRQVRERAAAFGVAGLYTRQAFMEAAGEFFSVEDHGLWDRRPLLVLHRRPPAG